ncbi:MAG: diacylglycerol/lipid kinase family protein [Phototrophicaceae bacterium]
MAFEHIHLIINPASGQPEPILQNVNKVLHPAGVCWSVSVTTAHSDGTALARQAVEEGTDLVMVYGGDGTVKSVVNGLVEADIPLALLQGGTGNAMASELGIPADLSEATRLVISDHRQRGLDLGKVTCEGEDAPDEPGYFMLRSSVGLQSRILKQATPELKEQLGNFAYLLAGVRSVSESMGEDEMNTFRITIDDDSFEADGLTLMVANSAAVGGTANFFFAPDVDPSDGELDVFVLDSEFASIAAMMVSSLNADLSQYPKHWRGKKIRVELDDDPKVTLDGEPFANAPMTVEVIPQAVQVIVPA